MKTRFVGYTFTVTEETLTITQVMEKPKVGPGCYAGMAYAMVPEEIPFSAEALENLVIKAFKAGMGQLPDDMEGSPAMYIQHSCAAMGEAFGFNPDDVIRSGSHGMPMQRTILGRLWLTPEEWIVVFANRDWTRMLLGRAMVQGKNHKK